MAAVKKYLTPSRQQLWQARRVATGNCRTCGQLRGEDGTKNHCRKCADAHNQTTSRYRQQHLKQDV